MATITYRALDANGDYTFGQNGQNMLQDSPAAVAQAIKTRLLLLQGEYPLDLAAGVPYLTSIMGYSGDLGQVIIKNEILKTPGVLSITSFSATLQNRTLTITANVVTEFGNAAVLLNTSQ
jgi:hypothetical protein